MIELVHDRAKQVNKNRSVNGSKRSEKETRLNFLKWSDLYKLPTRQHLIEGVLDRGGFSVVYGASNTGKTFFTIDLSAHVATGQPWHGRKVHRTGTLLISPDTGIGIRERLTAWAEYHSVDTSDVELYVLAEPINMCDGKDDMSEVFDHLRQAGNIGLVVIDTLSRALAGGDENSSRDMGRFVGNVDMLRDTGAHVVVVHHTGKDDSRGARGHSLLRAAVDTEIEVTEGCAAVTKQRDHVGGDRFGFDLKPVLSSCVAVATDKAPERKIKGPRLSASHKIALDALIEALADKGTVPVPSDHIPKDTITVPESVWRDYAIARGISDAEEQRSKNQAFKRAADALQANRKVGRWEGQVWV